MNYSANQQAAVEGAKRAGRVRTRLQTRLAKEDEAKREAAKMGLSQQEYWKYHVKSKDDIIRFYQLYHPEYPDVLAKAIAERVSGIVEKSQRGETLTPQEKEYYIRSQKESELWDPTEEIKKHELDARVQLSIKHLEELKTMD